MIIPFDVKQLRGLPVCSALEGFLLLQPARYFRSPVTKAGRYPATRATVSR